MAEEQDCRARLHELLDPVIAKSAAIERDKHGKALTEDEAKTLRVNDFLRKIAPYLFTTQEAPTLPQQRPTIWSVVGKLLR